MNKDKSLKKKGTFLVFLICGNSLVGKKTFVENFIKSKVDEEVIPINKSFYNVYLFDIIYEIEEKIITLPIEIRIINSKIYFYIIKFKKIIR
jgi:septin family protein